MSSLSLLYISWIASNITTIILVSAYLLSISMALVVISENRNPSKTLAYLLMFFALPFIGVAVYFVFGENYRKKKIYKKKWLTDQTSSEKFGNYMVRLSEQVLTDHMDKIGGNANLVRMLVNDSKLPISVNNKVRVLLNGEEKFPAVIAELEKAHHHIHIEYYIFEEGKVADLIREVLVRKSLAGVEVRIMYDDFGSDLGKKYLASLREAGIKVEPFYNGDGSQLVQVAFSGPDSDRASIMLSYFAAINNSREYVYITTPYFIPNESILDALKKAALSKVDVRMIVPGISDSRIVNAAAMSYYEELLAAGVKIYLYKKGFTHSKMVIADHSLSMVGTANMDIRSFDLNFEVNAVVFDTALHNDLKKAFMADVGDSVELKLEEWIKRPNHRKMFESCCRLLSALM